MSRCLPTPSGFALYLHGNICHGPKSWCRSSPRVCCRHLVVGSLLPRLVPLVGMPNKDSLKNREGDGSLALGGCRWVVRHSNQPIAGGSNRRDDGEDVQPGWSVWVGCFSYFGVENQTMKKITKIKYNKGLRWPPFNILDATTNQKQAGVMEEGWDRPCDHARTLTA
jgi:hypothetical protein